MIKKTIALFSLFLLSTTAMAQWVSPPKKPVPMPYTYDSYNQNPENAAKIKEAQKSIKSAIDVKKQSLNDELPTLKWSVTEVPLPPQVTTPPLPQRSNMFGAPPQAPMPITPIAPASNTTTINHPNY